MLQVLESVLLSLRNSIHGLGTDNGNEQGAAYASRMSITLLSYPLHTIYRQADLLCTQHRQMHNLLAPTVEAHIQASQVEDVSLKPKKDVLDWALSQHPSFTVHTLIDQVKTFVLAGHDTASSTLAWTYYHLSQSPRILNALRNEHTIVFDNHQNIEVNGNTGKCYSDSKNSTIGREGEIIQSDPTILNDLKYTLAVMRESLRLYPPASAVRQAKKTEIYEVQHQGQKYSVAGCMLWINHWCLHRSKGENEQ